MKHRKMSKIEVKKQLLDNFFRRNICHYCYYICKKTSCQGTFNKSTLVKNVGSCIFSECNVTKSNLTLDQLDLFGQGQTSSQYLKLGIDLLITVLHVTSLDQIDQWADNFFRANEDALSRSA